MKLPQRYIHRDCTVGLMMMKSWQDSRWEFPNLPPGTGPTWSSVEKVSLPEVVEWAGYVRSICADGMGYTLLGEHEGLAVALWGTGSLWDHRMGYRGEVQGNDTALLKGPLPIDGTNVTSGVQAQVS